MHISGSEHVQNITVRYDALSRWRERRSYGLTKHLVTSGTTRSLALQADERITKLEKITRHMESRSVTGKQPRVLCHDVSFLRLTTSHDRHIQIGAETKGVQPELSKFGPGRFFVRLKADVDQHSQRVTSINPIFGSFEISEWL